MIVCPSCFGASTVLEGRFRDDGKPGTCPTCFTDDTLTLDASKLSDLFEGLKRRYGPIIGDPYRLGKQGIHGYGPDSGQESLVDLLRVQWEVFSDSLEDEDAERILFSVWPGYSGEYSRCESYGLPDVDGAWAELKESLTHKKRFFLDDGPVHSVVTNYFDPYVDHLSRQTAPKAWFRARIQPQKPGGFGVGEMGAPPRGKASAGRANPAGISYLYVASDEATAVAEVRAEPGDWVTVASVTLPKGCSRVLDTVRIERIVDPFAYGDLGPPLMVRSLLWLFASELSRPVRESDHQIEYVGTQFLCEYFRTKGFDGVIYPSAMTGGINAVFFDPAAAEITDCVDKVVGRKKVEVIDSREYERRQRKRKGLQH